MLHCIDFKGEIYMRQERNGILLGTYEKACAVVAESTPWDFGHELLPPDLDRIADHRSSSASGISRHSAKAGIKKVINGPFTFAPDGNPLVGPVQGLRTIGWPARVMAGFSQGGGVGLALSNWMVEAIRALTSGPWMSRASASGHTSLHQRQGARELRAPLPHHLPE